MLCVVIGYFGHTTQPYRQVNTKHQLGKRLPGMCVFAVLVSDLSIFGLLSNAKSLHMMLPNSTIQGFIECGTVA
jgi:hypothetical protein